MQNATPYHLEVCVDSAEGCRIATDAGATRIELSVALDQDGLTPPEELIAECLAITSLPIIALVRCRPGNFLFNDDECELMLNQCSRIAEQGVAGLAVGAIAPASKVDHAHDSLNKVCLKEGFLREIAERYARLELVVHRAFDSVSSPLESLEFLKTIGFTRVLTSGGPPTAQAGIQELRSLQDSQLLEVLPAGGINSRNAELILSATGCTQLHGSFRKSHATSPGFDTTNSKLPNSNDIKATREVLHRYFCQKAIS